jgi:hypothetical protein
MTYYKQNNSQFQSVPERIAVPVPLVLPVVLLLNDTNIIGYGHRVGHQYALMNTKAQK